MFRLQRQNRATKSGERIDFKFSNFQAIQVPKGWDKLCVSVISVETGRQVAKSSKAPARNGNCQWVESFSESIWVSQDESTKAPEECLFKFVVAMGSVRSGILGEATVNMADYMSSKASVPILLPLKKCNHGSILQVKIQCLTPRTKLRDDESKHSNSHMGEQDADHRDMGSEPNGSNVGSPSSKDLVSASHTEELQSRETSFSTTSFHSLNGDDYYSVGRQDSISSVDSSPHIDYPAEDPCQSNQPSFTSTVTHRLTNDSQNQRNDSHNQWQKSPGSSPHVNNASSSPVSAISSKNVVEAAEDTIEELRAEAKKWERDARKLMIDLGVLRMEFSDQSRKQADLAMDLAAAYMECDGLKKEVETMKIMLEESMLKEKSGEDSSFQSEAAIRIRKEMENEIKFQRECNDNLSMQLERSQESNIELLSVLQELEETVEKQKVEIMNLSALELRFNDMENSIKEKSEENRSLLLQLERLQESEKKLQVNLQLLDQAFEDKSKKSERDSSLNNRNISQIEMEYKCKLSSKEQEIAILEAKLSEALVNRRTDELDTIYGSKDDLMREIDALKEKLQELETDCSELTNENLDLLFKLKDYKSNCTSFDNSNAISELELSDHRSHIHDSQEELKKTMIKKDRLLFLESCKIPDLVEQLQMAFYHVKKPWYNIPSQVSNDIESDLYDLVDFKNTGMNDPTVFADSILNSIVGLNNLLEERIVRCEQVVRNGELEMKERNDCIVEAQKMVADYILNGKKLSLSVQELEIPKIGLKSSLEHLAKELEEKRMAFEKLEANLLSKEEEIGFLRKAQGEFESQISDLEMEKAELEENKETVLRESKVTSKCLDDLRNDLNVLSSRMDSLISENKILETKCLELEKQKQELEHQLSNLENENVQLSERMSDLETQFRESQEKSSKYSKMVEALEANLSEMLEAFSSKEKSMTLEIDALLQENGNQKEKLARVESLLNQTNYEKDQSSAIRDEKERIASEALHEVSSLRAAKAKLEYDIEELKSKVKLTENELDFVRRESEAKVQGLISKLSSSEENHELLVAACEKMLKSLGSKRSSEEKLSTAINDLEVKLTVSEHESQQLIEETANLKVQLQKVALLHEEILGLKCEKEKMEATTLSVSRDCEELKAEKIALIQKMSSLEAAMDEFEECKFQKVALEEKLSRVESDMLAREKGECLKKSQALEGHLKSMEEHIKGDTKYDDQDESPCATEVDQIAKVQLLENELAQAMEVNNKYKMQLHRILSEGRSNQADSLSKSTPEGEVVAKEIFERTKSSLERELKDLQDRYFQMSLKYAEVEAQREDLVMKLREAKNGKKWFS